MEYQDYINHIQNLNDSNNAWNAQQVQKQMDFQKMMSDTAHQREVADLKAAGLNPVLSSGGSGAASMQGAAAQSSGDLTSALGSIVQTILSTENSKAIAEMNNSASMLRQQQSDDAAMQRLLIQVGASSARSGSSSGSGAGSGSSLGSRSTPSSGVGVYEWTQGFIDSLPDKGSTRVGKITLPNSALKYLWNTLGPAAKQFIENSSYSEILAVASGENVNSGKEGSFRDKDPQALNPYGNMASLGTYQDKVNSANQAQIMAKGVFNKAKALLNRWKSEESYWAAKRDVTKRKRSYS